MSLLFSDGLQATPIIGVIHGILADDQVPGAAKHRYYRIQVTSGGTATCGATKRRLDEAYLMWDGVYQVNAKSGVSTGTIGALAVTVTDNGNWSGNAGWYAFNSGSEYYPPDGAGWGGGPNFDPTGARYVVLDFGSNPVAITAWKLTALVCPIDGARFYYSDDDATYTLIAPSEFYNRAVPFTDAEYTWTYADLMP